MKSARIRIAAAALAAIALTAALLVAVRGHQRLGKPGVRLGHFPTLDTQGKLWSEESVILPETAAGMGSRVGPISDAEFFWLPKDTTFGRRIYTAADGFFAQLSVVLMGLDRTSIHRPEGCLPSQGWTIERIERTTIRLGRPLDCELPAQRITAKIFTKTPSGETRQVNCVYIYWFVADGLVTDSHITRELWIFRDLIFKQVLDRWAYVSYFAPCVPGREEECFERLKKVIADSVPAFQTSFPGGPRDPQSASVAR